MTPCSVNLGGKEFFVGQPDAALCSHHVVRRPLKYVAGHGLVFLRSENQPCGWGLSLLNSVLLRIIEVAVHLTSVGVGKCPDLQVYYNDTSQPQVK